MLQRIQTVYLLLTVALMALLLSLPIGRFMTGDVGVSLKVFTQHFSHMGMSIVGGLAGLILILTLVTIFMFKNRKRQSTICLVIIALLLVTQGLIACIFYGIINNSSSTSISYSFVALFPLVSIIFVWLARRGVMKDQRLVRSMDRLR